MPTTCVFILKDNALLRVSGADAGAYQILNNRANVIISGVTTEIDPFDKNKSSESTNNVITIKI